MELPEVVPTMRIAGVVGIVGIVGKCSELSATCKIERLQLKASGFLARVRCVRVSRGDARPTCEARAFLSHRKSAASARTRGKKKAHAERCWEGCFKLEALQKRNKRRWSSNAPRKKCLVCLVRASYSSPAGLSLAYAHTRALTSASRAATLSALFVLHPRRSRSRVANEYAVP